MRRALALLRGVAKCPEGGIRLAQLVRASGLDRTTAYRLLTCLVEEGFVDRDAQQLYRLGPQAVMLGSLTPTQAPLVARFGPGMKRIARLAGDTVFLIVRRGDMVQCEHRELGGGLVKILTTDIGQLRLLGTGTGGEAITGLLDDDELGRVWARHSAAYLSQGLSLQRLLAQAYAVRAHGVAITRDAVELGVAGIGAAFHIGNHGMAALSIATLTARFSQERQQALSHLLKEEIAQLGPHL